MSSSEIRPGPCRRIVLLGLATLAGCGFSPVYGTGGVATGLRNSIDFQTPDTPDGYHLRRQLEDRLGVAGTAKYVLTVAMDSSEDSVAIASDDTATRVNLIGSATWALRDQDGQALANGEVSMFVGYSTTGTTVATRAAEQDAHQRLSVALADQIVTRLIIAAPDF